MEQKNIKTVIVLGMHRSGTSMIAGVLSRMGVDMGKRLEEANRWNPLGYYENKDFMELNNKILGGTEDKVIKKINKKDVLAKKERFEKVIKDLIAKSQREMWGWKDPRTNLTIDLFLPYLVNPYFVVCYRDQEDIALSLERREQIKREEAFEIINFYNKQIDEFFSLHPGLKRINLHYREVIKYPRRELACLTKFLGLNLGESEIVSISKFINPKQRLKIYRIGFIFAEYLKKIITRPHRLPCFIYKKLKRER